MLDARTLLGAAFLLIAAASVVRVVRLRLQDELAFAIGLVVFGLIAVFGLAFTRDYLTNWHVQLVLPALVGTLVLTWFAWRKRRAAVDRCLWFGACSLALLGLVGWYAGFREGGPQFAAYVGDIERYIVTYEANPNQPKPFPTTRLWDIDHDMIAFLRSKNHPVFSAPTRHSGER